MESQKRIVIKASLENVNEIRRFAPTSPNFAQICETIKQIFSINAPFSIHYKDNEGDLLIISNDLELKEALCLSSPLRVFIKQSEKINPISKVIESPVTDEKQKQKAPISEPSAENVICDAKKAEKEWKPFWTTNPEIKEAREKILAAKQRVLAAREKVTTSKKDLIAAREDLFAAKKKFCEQIRIAREKKHSDNPSSVEPDGKCPKKILARFVKHVTVPENSELPPGREFVKTWRFRNEANKPWPVAKLQFVGKSEDDRLAEQSTYDAGTLAPGQEKDISINMKTPTLPGRYVSNWRLFDPETRAKFGQRVCAQVNVVDASSGSSSGSSEEDSYDKKAFAELLKQLHDMGFTDQKKNLRILKRCKGDLSMTVQQLVKQLKEPKFAKH